MERYFSPRAVAAALGVSESSLKRWVDEGRIAADRTAGGHRRITQTGLLSYLRKEGVAVVNPSAIGYATETDGTEGAEVIQDAIASGDGDRLRESLLRGFMMGQTVADLCDGPIRKGLHLVGERWREGDYGIAEEHRAVEAVLHALYGLRSELPEPSMVAPLAMGGAGEGDPYRVPSLMVALVLTSVGWRVENLGADLPMGALREAMTREKPQLVWLSFSERGALRRFLQRRQGFLTHAGEIGCGVVLGGRAISSTREWEEDVGRLHLLPDMRSLAVFAQGMIAMLSTRGSLGK